MKIRYFSDLHLEFIEDNEMNTFLKQIPLPNNNEVVFADTVGFIRHLPHELVAAFKSTLQEATEADARR